MRASDEFEPVLVARIGPHAEPTAIPRPARTSAASTTIRTSTSSTPTRSTASTGSSGRYRDKFLYTVQLKRPPAVVSAGRRPLPAHALRRVRPGHADTPAAARRADRLHAARVHTDLPSRRPARAHQGRGALHGCHPRAAATSASPSGRPQHFFLRERLIKNHLAHVDLFLAPSNFLLERYVDWGIPRDKIVFEDYGRLPETPAPDAEADRPRNRLGFFGQISPYKGLDVLLEAMRILLRHDAPDVHLWLHGANIDVLPPTFARRSSRSSRRTAPTSPSPGRTTTRRFRDLMSEIDWVVVPSRWWENSPLVIQEAFMHGRPVICSDIGGMAEKVTHQVNGLHFTVGSPAAWRETIRGCDHPRAVGAAASRDPGHLHDERPRGQPDADLRRAGGPSSRLRSPRCRRWHPWSRDLRVAAHRPVAGGAGSGGHGSATRC